MMNFIILIYGLINCFFFNLASDGVSNQSFTFNGDSMNNSTSNPTDLDLVTTPLKMESRSDKIQVSTPKNFNNLSNSISNGISSSSFRTVKRPNRSFVSDNDVREENKQVNFID